jgi:uncharacterized protein YhbP (UPF0306 family)
MDQRIVSFLGGQKVATICCVDEQNRPYCFSCFYAFDKESNRLYFKSSPSTRHASLLLERPEVSGTVQPDRLNPMAIKGIQFSGEVLRELLDPNDHLLSQTRSVYYKKYPFALAMAGEVFTIQLQSIKMTDNALSFGKKILWEMEQEEPV